jgi:hypothetical protein
LLAGTTAPQLPTRTQTAMVRTIPRWQFCANFAGDSPSRGACNAS